MEDAGEVIIGSPMGVTKARSYRRKGSLEDRLDAAQILNTKGTPWEPVPGQPGAELRVQINLSLDPVTEPLNGTGVTAGCLNLWHFRKKDLEKYGTTQGCYGCSPFLRGRSP